jgi:hypothetical protein
MPCNCSSPFGHPTGPAWLGEVFLDVRVSSCQYAPFSRAAVTGVICLVGVNLATGFLGEAAVDISFCSQGGLGGRHFVQFRECLLLWVVEMVCCSLCSKTVEWQSGPKCRWHNTLGHPRSSRSCPLDGLRTLFVCYRRGALVAGRACSCIHRNRPFRSLSSCFPIPMLQPLKYCKSIASLTRFFCGEEIGVVNASRCLPS